jgi:hypothetical protein
VPALPAEFIRATAKLAGVHLYIDSDDVFYANSQMVAMYTRNSPGPRTIKLPRASMVFDLLDGLKPVTDGPVTEFTIDAKSLKPYAWWLADTQPTLPKMP